MHVVVSAASRYGATTEIAAAIAAGLTRRGVDATAVPFDRLRGFDDCDAVVLGSAVYYGQWLAAARELVQQHSAKLASLPVWLFSSGPVGPPESRVPKRNEVDVSALVAAVHPVEHRLFAGKVDPAQLKLREKAVTKVIGGPAGDFRDWAEIDAFAGQVAAHLASLAQPVGAGR
jgi:menaquinone-dependent protoporphyrinogen oxidase